MFRPNTLHRFSNLSLSTTRTFSASARANIARMTIVGRLASEPERVNTSTGRELIKYVIGSNYGSRGNQKTSWFRVTSFEENEERIKYMTSLPKGTLLYVEAEPQLQTYTVENETSSDGKPLRRNTLNLIHRNFTVLKRGSGQDQFDQGYMAQEQESRDTGRSAPEEPMSGVGHS